MRVGLGKTVTMLALCLSTAGTMPNGPSVIWSDNYFQQIWETRLNAGILSNDIQPIINSINKLLPSGRIHEFDECRVVSNLKQFANYRDFEKKGIIINSSCLREILILNIISAVHHQ